MGVEPTVEVSCSLAVRSSGPVMCVLRDVTGEFLLLAADDDLSQGVRCRDGGHEILDGLIARYPEVAALEPGHQAIRSPAADEWHTTLAPDYSRIEYGIGGDVRWAGTAADECDQYGEEPGVYAMRSVLNGEPILCVVHDNDGSWYLWGASGEQAEELEVFSTSWESATAKDPSVMANRDLPIGWSAIRDSPASSWRRELNDE